MAQTTSQTYGGRSLTVGEDVIVCFENVLYGGECTAIDDVTDQPNAIFDAYTQNGGPFAYWDGEDKTLAPDMTWMWPY